MAMRRQVRDGGIQLDAMSYGAAMFACEKVGLKSPGFPVEDLFGQFVVI